MLKSSLLRREVIPFYLWFGGLVLASMAIDTILHLTNAVWIGRYLGIPGVLLILGSFGHSLRKRGFIKNNNPLRLLRLHERIAWLGSVLILVHAGIHFNAILAWLAVVAMLVNVASGLTGKYLLQRGQRWLKAKRERLRTEGLSEDEVVALCYRDSLTLGIVKRWRVIHLPISLAFAGLATAHILAVFLFWGWK